MRGSRCVCVVVVRGWGHHSPSPGISKKKSSLYNFIPQETLTPVVYPSPLFSLSLSRGGVGCGGVLVSRRPNSPILTHSALVTMCRHYDGSAKYYA